MILAAAVIVGVALFSAVIAWLLGGRLRTRGAIARRRKFEEGLGVSIPILVQATAGPPPSIPPHNFGATLRVRLEGHKQPELHPGGPAMGREEFEALWDDLSRGWSSGGLEGRLVDDRYWYLAVRRRFPPSEFYMLLLNPSDWELIERVLRQHGSSSDPAGKR